MPSRRQLQRTIVAVGLLVLIALSGCAGLFDTDSSTPSAAEPSTPTPSMAETPTSSVTQTSVTSPTASTTTLTDRLPAGLNDTGVHNVTRVIHAHQATAIKTPGVVTHMTNTDVGNISIVASVRVVTATNLTRVQYVSRGQRTVGNETQNTTTVIAANGTSVRQYTVTDGKVTLDNRRNRTELFDRALRGLSTARGPLQGTLRRGNFTVSSDDSLDDTTAVTLRADRYAGGQRYEAQNVVAYNATVRITADGLIRSATERIIIETTGNEDQYSFTYEFKSQPVKLPPIPQVPAHIRVESGNTSDG
jgi:hypothetical protein